MSSTGLSLPSSRDPEFLQSRLKLRQLRLLVLLAETRSVSVAADRLCVSQAAVSKARAELEAVIGMPVFSHEGSRWELTPMGRQLVSSATRIMAELDHLNSEYQMLRRGSRGTVVVGMRTVAMVPFIARACAGFKQVHPGVTISLLDGPFADLMQQMDRGTVHMIVAPFAEEPGIDASLATLSRQDHVVIASPGHPLTQQAGVDWEAAVQAAWCLPSPRTRTRVHLEAFLSKNGLPWPENVIEVNSFLMMTTLMQEMPLLNLAPVGFAEQLRAQRMAEVLPLSVGGAFDHVSLVWSARVQLPTAARLFREFVLELGKAEADVEAAPGTVARTVPMRT